MKIIPIEKYLPLPLQLRTGIYYSHDEVIEAVTKYTRQFEQTDIKPGIVRGGASETRSVHRHEKDLKWDDLTNTPTTPTEPLPAEGSAKSVCGGFYCIDENCKEQCQWCKEQTSR